MVAVVPVGDDHRVPGGDVSRRSVGVGDLHGSGPGEATVAPEHVDPRALGPLHLARVVEVRGELVAASENRFDVDSLGTQPSCRSLQALGLGEELDRPQQCLARDARPVGALAAEQLVLDDDRGAVAASGRIVRGVLAGGSSADDDDVPGVTRAAGLTSRARVR